MDLMNFKEIKIEVDRLLLAGHRKDDVFNRMSNKGVTNDKLAFIIAQYADPRRIEANKTGFYTGSYQFLCRFGSRCKF
jgi:hypothetical protein